MHCVVLTLRTSLCSLQTHLNALNRKIIAIATACRNVHIYSRCFGLVVACVSADDALTFSMPGVTDSSALMYAILKWVIITLLHVLVLLLVVMLWPAGMKFLPRATEKTSAQAVAVVAPFILAAYQCVEIAQGYMHEKLGIAPIWHDNANMMCGSYPSGISHTSSPQPGDLYVHTSGTYGHVAVITAVHSDTVDVLEQNSSPSGKNTYKVIGWLLFDCWSC